MLASKTSPDALNSKTGWIYILWNNGDTHQQSLAIRESGNNNKIETLYFKKPFGT